ncbi:MAG: hypothetical protein ACI80F_000134 [Natronomonas sp.]|jgi:hypothetical protein|uniref:hypothetical protein n=1 Tax=Natronomonas sp. TaxID=2184060 RepID=UPI00398A2318
MGEVTAGRVQSFRARLGRAVKGSSIVTAGQRVESTLSRWVEGSRIIQWFLAEPEPDVIVIDLRETYTIGPLLRVLDRVVDAVARVDERTGISDTLSRVWTRVEAEPLRITGILLAGITLAGLVGALITGQAITWWLLGLGISLLATRERRSASELAETRVGKALIAAFEPPEPPEKHE